MWYHATTDKVVFLVTLPTHSMSSIDCPSVQNGLKLWGVLKKKTELSQYHSGMRKKHAPTSGAN